ncbi:hypothetical protein ACFQET_07425, partial [Levilactobacillus tangyuanensis]
RISVLDVFYCPKNFETVANLILKCANELFDQMVKQLFVWKDKQRLTAKLSLAVSRCFKFILTVTR